MQPQSTLPSSSVVVQQNRGPGLLLRALYFILFGLWFSGIWAAVAWLLCVTIIGLPLGLYMLNRLPQVVTLRPSRSDLVITATGRVMSVEVPQVPLILRALYFVLIGWWFSAIWIGVAWVLSAAIIGLPFAFWMFNRTPAVITLARG